LIALLLIPSEGGTLSPARLMLLSFILILIIFWTYCGLRVPNILDQFARPFPIIASALLSLMLGLSLFLLRFINPEAYLPIYQRLSPLLWYLFTLALQSALYLLHIKNGIDFLVLKQYRNSIISSSIVFGLFIVILLFVSLTKLGITKDPAYWGEPGVPVLGWQFVAAILCGFGVLVHQLLRTEKSHGAVGASSTVQIIFPVGIYLTACALWLSVPVQILRNSFYAPITPPYTTPFPYSDAGFYDYLSQSLLIGTKYYGGIPPRPLYVIFLAISHFLFGQDYVRIIAFQTLALALFPVALYKLGTKLHSRAAGVTIALFAIFRELTTLWVSGDIRTASTKIFVTDFATSMGLVFVILVVIRWLEVQDVRSALVAGGAYGLLLLLRTQSLIILPFVFVLAWFAFKRKTKEWLIACILFGLLMTATVLPWLAHNYEVTGRFAFDDPKQMAVIYSQYSFTGNLDLSQFNFETDSVGDRLLSFTLANPGYVSKFIVNHFLDTEIGSLLALPLLERFNGLRAPVNVYWFDWDGRLEWYNLGLVIIYLAFIALGIGTTWQRLKWIGLTPLAFNVGYALANGISRFSSWRYNLPVDWIAYFYFGIGVIEAFTWATRMFGAKTAEWISEQSPALPGKGSFHTYIFIAAAFVFVGSLPWLAEGLAQPRYTIPENDLRQQAVAKNTNLVDLLLQPDSQIIEGRLLYPRFLRKDDGIYSSNPWPAYKERDFGRMGFVVINNEVHFAIFTVNKPIKFLHGADVIVIGCQRADYLEAWWVYFPDTDETYQSENNGDPCES